MVLNFETMPAPWPHLAWPLATALIAAGAIVYRNAFLAALAPLALGVTLGGGTAYWHASYAIFVNEPTISIALFGILAGAAFWLRYRVAAAFELPVAVFGRVSFVIANVAFWVGSLWGDYIRETWAGTGYDWQAIDAWEKTATYIPSGLFTALWFAAALLALIWHPHQAALRRQHGDRLPRDQLLHPALRDLLVIAAGPLDRRYRHHRPWPRDRLSQPHETTHRCPTPS